MALTRFLIPLAASAALALPVAASAQTAPWQLRPESAAYRNTDDAVSYYDARRIAYDEGYRDGLKEGENDARRGDRFDFQDERNFQRADKGYHRTYGDRERYRQVFRDGYTVGYREGYSRGTPYGRNQSTYGPYRQQGPYGSYPQRDPYGYPQQGGYGQYDGYNSPAFDNGTRDGYEKGLEDARKNRSFDVLRHAWYRSGDRHYEGRYGSREQYRNIYRRGFQQGYDRGYREGRYRY
jgi:flagellar biosynthesis/type III secretory pathway protein FliH